MTTDRLKRIAQRHTYLFALVLLVITLMVNYALQSNLFELRVLNSNLRNFLPLIVLTLGQTIVIIGGGIDLSVGAMVSMSNAILVTLILPDSGPGAIVLGVVVTVLVGMAAGAFNGFCVAYLRLQPIITTYATSFVYSGIALLILPRPGGSFPRDFLRGFRETPLGIPMPLYFIVLAVIIWLVLRATRYGQFLFATGGDPDAAYATGVLVNRVRFSTYVWAGVFSALSALALTMNLGSGSPTLGDDMTLTSVVAVVLGGTRLSGGQGGFVGSVLGVLILGIIRNIISFADVPTWSQTLVDALIIIAALAGPGLARLIRRRFA